MGTGKITCQLLAPPDGKEDFLRRAGLCRLYDRCRPRPLAAVSEGALPSSICPNRVLEKRDGKLPLVTVRPSTKLCLGNAGDPRRQHGFTLLELLVVLAILGLLIGLVAPAALRQLGSAKEKIAHQSIERLTGVLDIYKLDVGVYPSTEQGLQALITKPSGVTHWNGPYLRGEKVPEDPWGRPFVYRSPSQRPGHEYDLLSLGPTGQPGGSGATAAIVNE
jgi:general secretion pathway protein G